MPLWTFTESLDTTDAGYPVRTQTLLCDGKPVAVVSLHPCQPGSVTPEPVFVHYQATTAHVLDGVIETTPPGKKPKKAKKP